MADVPFQFAREMEDDFDFDAEIIRRNHLQAEMLAKKGVKVKMPLWKGLMAS